MILLGCIHPLSQALSDMEFFLKMGFVLPPFTTSKTAWQFAPNELFSFHGVVLFGGFLWQQSCHPQSSYLKNHTTDCYSSSGSFCTPFWPPRGTALSCSLPSHRYTQTHIIIIMKQIFKYYDIYNMWFKISSGLQ